MRAVAFIVMVLAAVATLATGALGISAVLRVFGGDHDNAPINFVLTGAMLLGVAALMAYVAWSAYRMVAGGSSRR